MREHGYARYRLDKCRCKTCREATTAYNRHRNRLLAYGRWQPFVDAAPVRAHLAALAGVGITAARVSTLTGISKPTLSNVLGRDKHRPGQRVRRENADLILSIAVTPANIAPGALVDSTGTVRRIQALCCIGWTLWAQARFLGMDRSGYHAFSTGALITARNAGLVAGLYDRLSMTPAPASRSATRARGMAAEKGWAPPLAWDDETIDDPDATPIGSITRAPRESLDDFLHRYQQVADEDLTWDQVAERLGVTLYAAKSRVLRARRTGKLEAVAA